MPNRSSSFALVGRPSSSTSLSNLGVVLLADDGNGAVHGVQVINLYDANGDEAVVSGDSATQLLGQLAEWPCYVCTGRIHSSSRLSSIPFSVSYQKALAASTLSRSNRSIQPASSGF